MLPSTRKWGKKDIHTTDYHVGLKGISVLIREI